MGQVSSRRIAEGLASRPVLVTNHYPEFDTLPYHFMPFYGTEEVVAGPSEGAEGMQPIDILFGDRISRSAATNWRTTISHLAKGSFLGSTGSPCSRWTATILSLSTWCASWASRRWVRAINSSCTRYQVGEVIINGYSHPIAADDLSRELSLGVRCLFSLPGWLGEASDTLGRRYGGLWPTSLWSLKSCPPSLLIRPG